MEPLHIGLSVILVILLLALSINHFDRRIKPDVSRETRPAASRQRAADRKRP